MGEFWAAIIGAIVGAIAGGGITWLLQHLEAKRAKADHDQSMARSLLYKLIRIYNDLDGFRRHANESKEHADEQKLQHGWQSLRPIANGPDKIALTPDEMSYVLSLKEFPLFNEIMQLEMVHSSTIEIFETYANRRISLMDTLPAMMNGIVGTTQFDAQQYAHFAPKAAELERTATDILLRVDRDASEAKSTLLKYNAAIGSTLGKPMELGFPKETD